ncbi:hypothetical protein JTE90_008840 [Oedothorax gibbosus]|uniref:Uncharacterized protein n=1 Tax=Oedothorax gibbosus TaxID=931172 RepID=A0AAV6UB21_9ARAC|nr:hypothetical protein JTE90_008840 [Oedothorax gibbosus]
MENVEIIRFNERFCGRKVIKQKPVQENEDFTNSSDGATKNKIFNIKHARYEVMRFAVNGFDKEKQKNSKIAMAIRLGAKPPKKEYVNYKVLMEQKLKDKEKKTEQPNKYTIQKLKGRKKSKSKKKSEESGQYTVQKLTGKKNIKPKKKMKNPSNLD